MEQVVAQWQRPEASGIDPHNMFHWGWGGAALHPPVCMVIKLDCDRGAFIPHFQFLAVHKRSS
jgi:hypothetical protein